MLDIDQSFLTSCPSSPQSYSPSFPSAFRNCIPRHMKTYGCVCISPNSRFLIVKGALGNCKYSLPKGHMEGNESDLQCALRELYEETSIRPSVPYAFFTKFKHNNKKSVGGYFVFFLPNEPTPTPLDTNEILDAKWLSLEELESLDNYQCNVDLNQFKRWIKTKVLNPNQEFSAIHNEPCVD